MDAAERRTHNASIREQRCQLIMQAIRQVRDGGNPATNDAIWSKVRDSPLFPHYSAFETMSGLIRSMYKRGELRRHPDDLSRRNVHWEPVDG